MKLEFRTVFNPKHKTQNTKQLNLKQHIKYRSTNLRSPEVSFSEALLGGLAPDGGLYLPNRFPVLSATERSGFAGKKYHEIAFEVLNKLIGSEIESSLLAEMCSDVYNFPVPLEKVSDRNYIMRLDQGPTASFKDFAARMMSRLMQYYLSQNGKHLTILTATSGDTGSAVANAFSGLKNIDVIILFPVKEVTDVQRKQMTTLQDNISVIGLNGKFDDCQRLVKKAFLDPSFSDVPLSSANSINIGRLLPQSVYYFYAHSKLSLHADEEVFFSVPSGNFGNLMGGIIAKKMGLPVKRFIVATNENDEVPEYLRTGIYKIISPSKNCISSAMNVGHPSNLARIIDLYGGTMDNSGNILKTPDLERMRQDLFSVSIKDDITKKTIEEAYRKFNILLEPHGAVSWKGMKDYRLSDHESNSLCISLETAHPAKFSEELLRILNISPLLPASLSGLNEKKEKISYLENNYELLKIFILQHINK